MFRERARLDYPIAVNDEKHAEFKMNGIVFTARNNKGLYTRIKSPYDIDVPDFASLSEENLYNLSPHLQGTHYEDAVDMAERIQLLRKQAETVHQDGFLYPVKEKPFTWELRKKIPVEVSKQLENLKDLGLEVKVGLELEFSCPENSVDGFTLWRTQKRRVMRDLRRQISETTGKKEKKKLQEKLNAISKFNAREMLMYELIEMDGETKDVLEPLFGTGRDGSGYYDGYSVLELKIKPDTPLAVIAARKVVLKKLYDRATDYGLEITHHPSFHINVSFWNKKGNVLSDKNPSFSRTGKRITEGIARAYYESIFVLIDKYSARSDRLISLALDVHRQNLLRYSSSRIEVRPSIHDFSQDPEAILAILLSGAIFGLTRKSDRNIVRAKRVSSPLVHHEKERVKVTSHVLNNSTLRPNGTLKVSNSYIRDHEDSLLYELGLLKKPITTSIHPFLRAMFRSDNFPHLKRFFNNIRVEKNPDGKRKIIFPETSKGKYQFVIPAENMEKIPVEMQKRIRQGKKVTNDELSPFIRPGEKIPHPEETMTINVAKLTGKFEVVGFRSKYTVNKYDLNKLVRSKKPRNWTPYAWAKYRRLYYGRTLTAGFSPDFRKEFKDLAEKQARNERFKKGKAPTPREAAAGFFGKIKTRDYVIETKSDYSIQYLKENEEVEGRDFLRTAVVIKMERTFFGEAYYDAIKKALARINRASGRKHLYFIEKRDNRNGTTEITIEMRPSFLRLLRKMMK
jgi:hypothetical protein